jgi:hypothetical protein
MIKPAAADVLTLRDSRDRDRSVGSRARASTDSGNGLIEREGGWRGAAAAPASIEKFAESF